METITIQNVPKSFTKNYGKIIDFEQGKELFSQINENIVFWNDNEIDNMGKTSAMSSNSF